MQDSNANVGIYEIMQTMRDRNVVENDMDELAQMAKNILMDKYFGKIQDIIKQQHIQVQNNPSKEVRLLHAFKPFMNENSHDKIDNIINSLIMIETFRSINGSYLTEQEHSSKLINSDNSDFIKTQKTNLEKTNLEKINPEKTDIEKNNLKKNDSSTDLKKTNLENHFESQSVDDSIHPDGIYDYDNACLIRKKNSTNGSALSAMMTMLMFLNNQFKPVV